MRTPAAPAFCALMDLMLKLQVPRRIRTTWPARLPAGRAAQASVVEVAVPVRVSGKVPEDGAAGAAVGCRKGITLSSGVTVRPRARMWELSREATEITFSPSDGAPVAYRPLLPLLPAEATTTTPWLTRRSAAAAVGYWGHWKDEPMLMLSTSAPSSRMRSMAATMMSALVEPAQPNTR